MRGKCSKRSQAQRRSLPDGNRPSSERINFDEPRRRPAGVARGATKSGSLPPPPNSFSEAAAVAIAQIDARTLQSIANGGFLERPALARYGINRTLAELLSESAPEEAACRRMIGHFSDYARTHAGEFSVLTAEYSNLTRALSLARMFDPPIFADMVLTLGHFCDLRGDYRNWKELLIQANAVEGSTAKARASLLLHLACAHERLGENEAALEIARAGLEVEKDDPAVAAPLLGILGHVEMNKGMLLEAQAHLSSGLALAQRSSDPNGLFPFFVSLGVVSTRLGDYESATRFTDQGMQLARERNNPAALVSLMTNLGVLLYHQGRFADALRVDTEGLEIARQIGYSEKQAALLQAMGGALMRLGEFDPAESRLREALEIASELSTVGISRRS